MKVGHGGYRGSEVPLPVEVLNLILSYTSTLQDDETQYTLWACCLVSRSWYAASISHLYAHPLLGNRNFDKFARTICPPVSAHKPKIGLENFITRLDMSGLAYESSKSLTARLLRRTRNSLESFAAPAVTFSIACLAPLSKCAHLKLLDLSCDSYEMTLPQLLDSIGHLSHLVTLKLPRNALRGRCSLSSKSHWPVHLRNLQVSDFLYDDLESWATLFESWPSSIRSFKIAECKGYGSLHCLEPSFLAVDSITSFEIGISWHEDAFPFHRLLKTFPNIVRLTLPAYQAEQLAKSTGVDEFMSDLQSGAYLQDADHESSVEVLILTGQQPPATVPPALSAEILGRYVHKFPRLRRLEIPEPYARPGGATREYELLNDELERRGNAENRATSGLYLC
ncbi:hypothetical protein PV08_04562 [Exophiala spinifera]|uniref:F-box domain-containing protein n=1 Tax=Exophiala spinifera TaxID=91928 RepID=A0A0D2BEF0_9EURO|nr:uncharacterized protein PV08_04562 [Exophiala spinifera]KIW17368.1 hypothetical protein PV08_04562 [Exophiala spinifera]